MPSEKEEPRAGDLLPSAPSPALAPFQLIAHRGLSALAPENTIEAFDLALARGFHHFETDVQLTRDGHALVLHDETAAPGRTLSAAAGPQQTSPRPVAECTLAELRQMDAAGWFWRAGGPRAMLPPDAPAEAVAAAASAKDGDGATTAPPTPPPTLDEVLLRYKGKAHIHLELKSKQPGLARAVLDALERTGWRADLEERAAAAEAEADDKPPSGCGSVPGLTLTSFHLEQLLRVAEELDDNDRGCAAPSSDPPTRRCRWLRRHWLVQEFDPPTLQSIAEVPRGGLTGVCPRANAATREGVEAARQALRASGGSGCERRPTEVRAWGVRSLALLKRAVEVGADGATVNWPHLCAG
jgi:glycerophosphoryl diester phosphodiesterase